MKDGVIEVGNLGPLSSVDKGGSAASSKTQDLK